MGLGRDVQNWPSQAGASCSQHTNARRPHRTGAKAASLPQLLMGPKVTHKDVVATNAVRIGRVPGLRKLFFGTFYTYVRNRTNVHKKSVLLTQNCYRHLRFLPKILHSGGRRADAESVPRGSWRRSPPPAFWPISP